MTIDRRTRWLALIVLCLGDLMIVLDTTIVNVALPSIRESLGFSEASLAWVVNAYLLTFGGFMLLGGRLGDLFGQRRLFLAGIALFTTASLLCGVSGSQAMLVCAPGLREYQLQAVLEGTFLWHGAKAPAYGSIVGGGNNAVVLHYVENDRELADGDLVLIDAACEYQGYASDITRTFPVSGKFSPAQREIYDLVLKAQEAAVRATRARSSSGAPERTGTAASSETSIMDPSSGVHSSGRVP